MLLIEDKRTKEKKKRRRTIPKELIYEMRNGKPIYYRDYEKVIAGEKTLEEVMGSSKLQWILIEIILKFLFSKIDFKKYQLATNEAGFQWNSRSWRNLDIAIFNKEKLLKEGIDNRYAKTPPEIVIEIDTKADLRKYEGLFDLYMREKTQDLLDSGVKKIIWFTTQDKRVMVAEKDKKWFLTHWDENIELVDGIILNLKKLIEKEDIKIEC